MERNLYQKRPENPKKLEQNLLQRRLQIRKETEQLQAQLDELIGTNQISCNSKTLTNIKNTEDLLNTAHININLKVKNTEDLNNARIINEPQLQNANKIPTLAGVGVVPKETKTSIKIEALHKKPAEEGISCKKKTYNVEEAREYMRKQREKRIEMLKLQKSDTAITRELRKKKIDELQKKSMELVAKNLQAKRERSKSRERQDNFVRPLTNLSTACVARESRDTVKKIIRECDSRITSKSSSEKAQQEENTRIKAHTGNHAISKPSAVTTNQIIAQKFKSQRNPNLLYPPDYTLLQNNINNENDDANDTICIENASEVNPVILKPEDHLSSKTDEHYIRNQQINVEDGVDTTKVNILSNITLRPALNTAEEKYVVPSWLEESRFQSDPLNFINSVKRKIQIALNPPVSSVDVAVQSSVVESPKLLGNTSTDNNKKSDLKAFISYKCLNLDTKTLEHLALVPKTSTSKESSVNRTYVSESGSDTSKNIPSISSESGLSVKRNADKVKHLSTEKLNISTENLDNMKLKRFATKTSIHSSVSERNTSDSEIRTETSSQHQRLNKSCTDAQKEFSYSSDFLYDLGQKSLSKSRESIISHNCAKVSPNKISSVMSEKSCESYAGTNKPTSSKNNQETKSSNSEPIYPTTFEAVIKKRTNTKNPKPKVISSKETMSKTDSVSKERVEESKSPPPESNTIKTDGTSRRSATYNSLYSDFHESQTVNNVIQSVDSNRPLVSEEDVKKSEEKEVSTSAPSENVTSRKENGVFSKPNSVPSDAIPLREPKVLLKVPGNTVVPKKNRDLQSLTKNISLRTGDHTVEDKNPNQIHLKFEAEIHLLNDFNQSLKQLTEVEKAFESLRSKNNSNITTKAILQNRDTQTSLITKSSKNTVSDESKSQISTINFSRGSEINSEASSRIISDNKSVISNSTNLSQSNKDRTSSILSMKQLQVSNNRDESLRKKSGSNITASFGDFENLHAKNFAGLSLTMFDHLIRDEDIRLENLKTMLRIREQALLDRTKAELAMLEIQRKHLKETGQLQEASLVKKKQRGILVKHQQERHEMQRLKQMQKAASVERKIILKEQRNLIKHQLYTDNMLSKMKVNTSRERRLSGPLKVLQTCNESVRSERSVTKKSSTESEILSMTSRTTCSVMSVLSEDARSDGDTMDLIRKSESDKSEVAATKMKRTLLMREDALKKRSKAVQELLQWHNKLLEEEKRIVELESTANTIISQTPKQPTVTADGDNGKFQFEGRQLNRLWLNLTGYDEKKFVDDRVYSMSQIALERFCKSARERALKTKKPSSDNILSSDTSYIQTDGSISDNGGLKSTQSIPEKQDSLVVSIIHTDTQQNIQQISDNNEVATIASKSYSLDFDAPTFSEGRYAQEMDVVDQSKSKISSISELIDNFSKIKDVISSIQSKKVLLVNKSETSNKSLSEQYSPRTEKSASEISSEKPSVIDTAKSSIEQKVSEMPEHLISFSQSVAHTLEVLPNKTQQKDSSTGGVTKKSLATDKLSIEKDIRIAIVTKDNDSEKPSSEEDLESSTIKSIINSNKENTLDAVSLKSVKTPEEPAISVKEPVKSSIKELSVPYLGANIDDKTSELSEISTDQSNKVCTELDTASKEIAKLGKENLSDECEKKPQEDNNKEATTEKEITSEALSHISDKRDVIINSPQEEILSETKKSQEDNNKEAATEKEITSEALSHVSDERDVIIESHHEEILSKTKKPQEDNNKQSTTEEGITSEVLSHISDEGDVINHSPQEDILKTDTDREAEELANTKEDSSEEITHMFEKQDDESCERPQKVSGLDTKENKEAEKFSITDISDAISSISLNQQNKSIIGENTVQLPFEKESLPPVESPTNEYSTDFTSGEDYEVLSPSSDQEEQKTPNNCVIFEEIHSPSSKEDVNSCEEKEHDSLSNTSSTSSPVTEWIEREGKSSVSTDQNRSTQIKKIVDVIDIPPLDLGGDIDEFSEAKEVDMQLGILKDTKKSSSDEELSVSSNKSKNSSGAEKSHSSSVDVKKRVSEILAESSPRGDRSPRLQDLYVTTYDLVMPVNSPDSDSPLEEIQPFTLGSEAEELLRKQLAIEQEIKELTEQQQKQPFVYVREIPNKPPPPYTPPSSSTSPNVVSLLPAKQEEIEEITKYSAKIIHKAYVSNNLENISVSDNTLNLITKNINKDCYKFVFDLCKELAKEHYKEFETDNVPSWLQVTQKPKLAVVKPLDAKGLERHMNKKLAQLFNFKSKIRENTIIKWSRKKRDHVDEILVMESQAEEAQWTNFDRDELEIKNNVTNDIMKMLLAESVAAVKGALSKKSYLY